jgi:FkbM family methyltransferase
MLMLKKIAARLPIRMQTELKRLHFGWQINKGTFMTDEPEYRLLQNHIKEGDWVVDIGANVGFYTKRFSELVGAQGHVIAFEPVSNTFSILSANVQLFAHPNVTLINAAVSDKLDVAGMSIPEFSAGIANYYQAHLSSSVGSSFSVLTIPLDSLCINQPIALVKIDVEGHESFVLAGMQKLIQDHHPVLIVETASEEVIDHLKSWDYIPTRIQNSPNVLFAPNV